MTALLKLLVAALVIAGISHLPPVKPHAAALNEQRWSSARIRPAWTISLDKAVFRFQRDRARYHAIEAMRPHGMPAAVIFGLHGRESSWDFSKHLHEGSPLTHRTRDVPKGRPLGNPPFTFQQSAEDALYILKHEDRVTWSSIDAALSAIEAYNGTGYLRYHPTVPSPYVWSGTQLYGRGKYVSDGRFSATAVDEQPGVAAILLRMRDRGIPLPF